MRASTAPVALNPAAMAEEGSAVAMAFEEVRSSFDKFCLIAGIEALQELLQEEAAALCGERHQRHDGRRGRRWGETPVSRPRIFSGHLLCSVSISCGYLDFWPQQPSVRVWSGKSRQLYSV